MRYLVYKEKDAALLKMCDRNWYVCPLSDDDGSFELFATHAEALARAVGVTDTEPETT